MDATASIRETAEISAVKAASSLETAMGGADEDTPGASTAVSSKMSPSLSICIACLRL
jgi:hypothetical protein